MLNKYIAYEGVTYIRCLAVFEILTHGGQGSTYLTGTLMAADVVLTQGAKASATMHGVDLFRLGRVHVETSATYSKLQEHIVGV